MTFGYGGFREPQRPRRLPWGRQRGSQPRLSHLRTDRIARNRWKGLDPAALAKPISVPLLESHVRKAEALAEVLHVLDHVVQAADEDLLVSVVVDIVLDDLLDIAHAAFPIGRLGTRDRRVEMEIRMLPLPFLDEAAVDQVVHVSHAKHDMELVARVEAVRPDVAHHRDERGDA